MNIYNQLSVVRDKFYKKNKLEKIKKQVEKLASENNKLEIYKTIKNLSVSDLELIGNHNKVLGCCLEVKDFYKAKEIIDHFKCSSSLMAKYYYFVMDYENAFKYYQQLDKNKKNKGYKSVLEYNECLYKIKGKVSLIDFYNHEYIDNNKNELSIVFSTKPDNYMFYKHKFNTDVLFVSFKSYPHFYILAIDKIISNLFKKIKKSYNKIYLVGSSKACTGAIAWGIFLAKKFKELKIEVDGFCPQIHIYEPSDLLLNVPSVANLNKAKLLYSFFYDALNNYHSLLLFYKKNKLSNLTINCVVGETNIIDYNEIKPFTDIFNVTFIKNYPFHNVIALFAKTDSIEKLYEIVNNTDNVDEKSLNKNSVITFNEFVSIYNSYKNMRNKFLPMIDFEN